jgi:hypothetical protein
MTEAFTLNISETDIADLRERLGRTRFPDQATGSAWAYGTDVGWMGVPDGTHNKNFVVNKGGTNDTYDLRCRDHSVIPELCGSANCSGAD